MQEIFSLKGRVAIVTGASKGIGRAIAQSLAAMGASVVVSSRKQAAVDEVAADFVAQGLEAKGIACHVGDLEQVGQLAEQTIAAYGGIDIVVNNAATNPVFGPLLQTDESAFEKIMQVNIKGPLALAKAAHASMKERGHGSVINISSIEGITPGDGLGLYSMSKAAMLSMTKVMAREWGKDGIRANAIAPGLIATKFSEALTNNEKILKHVLAKQAIQRAGTPEEIAGLALFLASDAGSFCTGATYTADGGYTI